MKRLVAACTLVTLLIAPTTSYAHRRGHHHHGHRNAVAWGILGGIVGGVLLDQVLTPAPVVVRPRAYVVDPYYDDYAAPYGSVYTRRTYESYRPARSNCGRRAWDDGYRYRY